MVQNHSLAHQAALEIMREAVTILLQEKYNSDNSDQQIKAVIEESKRLLTFQQDAKIKPLRLLFDRVNITREADREKSQTNTKQQTDEVKHYWEIDKVNSEKSDNSEKSEFCPPVPYPNTQKPSNIEEYKNQLKAEIKLEGKDWENLSLLSLIVEKYGSFISFGEEDIAFCDRIRSTAALAAALANNSEAKELNLVAGDLSGIQNFIYTISSDGALKSLRARSFYLELVTEEIVQQLLEKLELPRTSVIYAGGGNIYILASGEKTVVDKVKDIQNMFNEWLFEQFQGKVFLALDAIAFNTEEIQDSRLSDVWQKVPQRLAKQKQQKFYNIWEKLLERNQSFNPPCKVCHRDDIEKLKPLSDKSDTEACGICCTMYNLGDKLLKVNTVI
ncbi:type III-A CRISPR-associated protein Cas10/Csm1, partial [Spirulina sp. 06S082]|uniref:type III-A CRISPR-associated protein Cas10/Csm1 n=1 Tax=Spirulina sp. 06S082 TaxID=3110248 RepID=UPI002B209D8A